MLLSEQPDEMMGFREPSARLITGQVPVTRHMTMDPRTLEERLQQKHAQHERRHSDMQTM